MITRLTSLREKAHLVPRERLRRRWQRLRSPAWLIWRRTTPLSTHYGFDRGTPIDRYYIDRFLTHYQDDVCGRVLEVMDNRYTVHFGKDITVSDVLDIDSTNSRATVIADLTAAETIPSNWYDCFVITQTLQFIYDIPAALMQGHRILRPGGTLLATVPGISKVDPSLAATDYWRFTERSFSSLVTEVFGVENVRIHTYGNVLTAIASLTGMAYEELSSSQLDTQDQYYPVIIAARAIKGGDSHERG